jgi:hypothetical protein
MYPGSAWPTAARIPTGSTALPAAGTTYPTRRRSPGRSSRTTTTPGPPGLSGQHRLDLTSSIRNPRSLTARRPGPGTPAHPRPATAPDPRSDTSAHPTRTDTPQTAPRSTQAVQISPRQIVPSHIQFPGTPTGTTSNRSSNTYVRTFQIGPPISGVSPPTAAC